MKLSENYCGVFFMSKKGMAHPEKGSFDVKVGLAEMLKGGVIMDVTTPEQAKLLKMPELLPLWLLSNSC